MLNLTPIRTNYASSLSQPQPLAQTSTPAQSEQIGKSLLDNIINALERVLTLLAQYQSQPMQDLQAPQQLPLQDLKEPQNKPLADLKPAQQETGKPKEPSADSLRHYFNEISDTMDRMGCGETRKVPEDILQFFRDYNIKIQGVSIDDWFNKIGHPNGKIDALWFARLRGPLMEIIWNRGIRL